jgi:hypothetical protein
MAGEISDLSANSGETGRTLPGTGSGGQLDPFPLLFLGVPQPVALLEN